MSENRRSEESGEDRVNWALMYSVVLGELVLLVVLFHLFTKAFD